MCGRQLSKRLRSRSVSCSRWECGECSSCPLTCDPATGSRRPPPLDPAATSVMTLAVGKHSRLRETHWIISMCSWWLWSGRTMSMHGIVMEVLFSIYIFLYLETSRWRPFVNQQVHPRVVILLTNVIIIQSWLNASMSSLFLPSFRGAVIRNITDNYRLCGGEIRIEQYQMLLEGRVVPAKLGPSQPDNPALSGAAVECESISRCCGVAAGINTINRLDRVATRRADWCGGYCTGPGRRRRCRTTSLHRCAHCWLTRVIKLRLPL